MPGGGGSVDEPSGVVTPRGAVELLEQRSEQRLAVANLGRSALSGARQVELAEAAVAIAHDAMGAEFALVLERDADDHLVAVAAGGFDDESAGGLCVRADPVTFLRTALDAPEPILVTDWARDDRFEVDDLVVAAKIRSACTATIRSPAGPIGIIAALSPRADAFIQDDCNYLRTIANVLGAARARQRVEDELRESLARLDTLLESSPVAFGFFDTELRFVRLNDRLATLSGRPAADHLGQTLADVLPDIWAQLEDAFRSVLDGGESARDVEVSAQLASAPGLERHFLASCYPVRTIEQVHGLGLVVVDITERIRAERASHLISDATELLTHRSELESVLDEAVQLPLPDFADSCQLFLFSNDASPWHAATTHSDGQVTRVALEGKVLYAIDPATPGAISDAVTTGRAQLIAHVPAEQVRGFAQDDAHLRKIEEHAAVSAIVAPLRAGATTLGLLFFTFTAASHRRYRPDDLALAEELAARFALVVDTVRLEVEAQRAQQRLDLLARAGSLMTVELATDTRMNQLAALPIPDFADACALHLVSDDGVFRLEVLQSADARLERALQPSAGNVPPGAPTPNADALKTRRAVLIADLPGALRDALGPEREEEARDLGLGSLLCAPLVGVDGRAFGTLTFVRGSSGRPFRDDDLPVAEELGRRSAAFFQHALRFEQEQATAEVLQRSLLPSTAPKIAGVATVSRYLPGGASQRVGGDWYDVVAFRDGGATVAIGDVVGHGVVAASSTGQLRAGVHLMALDGLGPAATLDRLNRLLLAMPDSEIATVAVLLYEPAEGTLRLSSAGHPPPLVVSADGAAELFEGAVSFPLRASAAARYEEVARPFAPGDTIVLYTDGLVERRGESLDVGLARLRAAAQAAPDDLDAMADHLLASVLPDEGPTDDVALLVLRAVADPVPLQLELPPRADELAAARGALRSWLAVSGVDTPTARDIVLAANEALANAVEHGSTSPNSIVTLHAEAVGGSIVVDVRDRGRWLEREPEPHRGRGLPVMRAVIDEVDIDPGGNGTTVRLRHRIER